MIIISKLVVHVKKLSLKMHSKNPYSQTLFCISESNIQNPLRPTKSNLKTRSFKSLRTDFEKIGDRPNYCHDLHLIRIEL